MAEPLPFPVGPFLARLLVQQLGECLRQPVRQRLGHDRVVVVVVLLEFLADRFQADAARHGKGTDIIWNTGCLRRDEIGQSLIELPRRLRRLIAKRVKHRQIFRARFVHIDFDVVSDTVGREEAVDATRSEQLAADDLVQQCLRVVEQFLGLRADGRILEDFWIAPAQLPGVEERRPIDERDNLIEWK